MTTHSTVEFRGRRLTEQVLPEPLERLGRGVRDPRFGGTTLQQRGCLARDIYCLVVRPRMRERLNDRFGRRVD